MAEPILFVEDDEVFRSTVAAHLRRHGYQVIEAASSEDAMARLSGDLRPSLVLLDLNLPGETGWGLLRSGAIAAAGGPPVVVTTALTVSPRRLAEFQVAGYLPKPFPLETLVDTVGRLLDTEGAQTPR
jgi:DNA-binding response OmpR family regulator